MSDRNIVYGTFAPSGRQQPDPIRALALELAIKAHPGRNVRLVLADAIVLEKFLRKQATDAS